MWKQWQKNVNTVAKEIWAQQQKLWKSVATKRRHTHNLHVLSPVPTWRMHLKRRSFLSSGHGRKRTVVYNRPSCRPCVKYKKRMQFKWFHTTSLVGPALQALQTLVPHAEETSCLCQACYTRRHWKQSTSVVADDEQPTQKKKNGQQCHFIGCEGRWTRGRGWGKACVCVIPK